MELPQEEVIFTIGRMNPPTPGHKKLIKQMMFDAISNNVPVIHIILSSTTGDKKNPLECDEKRMILYTGLLEKIKSELASETQLDMNKIQGLVIEVLCMNDEIPGDSRSPVIKSINYMLSTFDKRKKKNLRIYLGSDEVTKFDGLIGYLPKDAVWMPLGVSRPPGDISASELRNLTIRDKDKFIEAVTKLAEEKQKPITPKQIEELYVNRQIEFIRHMENIGIDEGEAMRLYSEIGEVINSGGRKKQKNTRRKNTRQKNTRQKNTRQKNTRRKNKKRLYTSRN
jgi:hypothetical protein